MKKTTTVVLLITLILTFNLVLANGLNTVQPMGEEDIPIYVGS